PRIRYLCLGSEIVSPPDRGGPVIKVSPEFVGSVVPFPSSSSIITIGSPSNSGSAKSLHAFLKSIIVKYSLPYFGFNLVPRPIICLNSVIELILLSSTISLHVLQSTPVVSSLEVVTITGY